MPITYNLIIVIPAIQQGMIVAAWGDPGAARLEDVSRFETRLQILKPPAWVKPNF